MRTPILLLALLLTTPVTAETKSRKEINFEGAVVEGVGRQSLDSLSQVADGNNQEQFHLYEKRDDYQERDQERLEELIETY